MTKKTERFLLKLTEDVAKKCRMDKAISKQPDPQQAENKRQAHQVLVNLAVSLGGDAAQKQQLEAKMKEILGEPVRYIDVVDEKMAAKYNRTLTAAVKKAIRDGLIPDPKKDKSMKDMTAL